MSKTPNSATACDDMHAGRVDRDEATCATVPSGRPMCITLRVALSDGRRIGPGKIALLEAIGRTGSITAAGRSMDMSYRRAWLLVSAVNQMFEEAVVETAAGGAHGGGARLTEFGAGLVAAYRALERATTEAADRDLAPYLSRLRPSDPARSAEPET